MQGGNWRQQGARVTFLMRRGLSRRCHSWSVDVATQQKATKKRLTTHLHRKVSSLGDRIISFIGLPSPAPNRMFSKSCWTTWPAQGLRRLLMTVPRDFNLPMPILHGMTLWILTLYPLFPSFLSHKSHCQFNRTGRCSINPTVIKPSQGCKHWALSCHPRSRQWPRTEKMMFHLYGEFPGVTRSPSGHAENMETKMTVPIVYRTCVLRPSCWKHFPTVNCTE